MNPGRVMRRVIPFLIGMVLSLPACADNHYAYDRPYYHSWAFSDGCCGFAMTRLHDRFDRPLRS